MGAVRARRARSPSRPCQRRPPSRPTKCLCRVDDDFICGTDPHIINGDFPGFWRRRFRSLPVMNGRRPSSTAGHGRAPWAGWTANGCARSSLRLRLLRQLPCRALHLVPELRPPRAGHASTATSRRCLCAVRPCLRQEPGAGTAGFDLEVSACVDPLSIALYTVKRSRLRPGDDLLVMGNRPQGLMAILCARAMGAGRIRRRRLGSLGSTGGVARRRAGGLSRRRRGRARCTNSPGTWRAGGGRMRGRPRAPSVTLCLAGGGVVSVIGIPHEEPTPPMQRIVLDEIEIVGDRANPNTARGAVSCW